jgi:hypothetical protein
MVNTSITAGTIATIFCKDEAGVPGVIIRTPNGDLNTAFPAVSLTGATIGGLPNGALASDGDILLKLVRRAADGTLTVSPGNHLNDGDTGLKVVIHHASRN